MCGALIFAKPRANDYTPSLLSLCWAGFWLNFHFFHRFHYCCYDYWPALLPLSLARPLRFSLFYFLFLPCPCFALHILFNFLFLFCYESEAASLSSPFSPFFFFADGNDWPGRSVMFGAKATWSCSSDVRLVLIASTIALVSLFGQHVVPRRIFWFLLYHHCCINFQTNGSVARPGQATSGSDLVNGGGSSSNQNHGIIAFFTVITPLIIFLIQRQRYRYTTDAAPTCTYDKLIHQFRRDINFHFRAFQAMDT